MKISHNCFSDFLIIGGGVRATRSALTAVADGAKGYSSIYSE